VSRPEHTLPPAAMTPRQREEKASHLIAEVIACNAQLESLQKRLSRLHCELGDCLYLEDLRDTCAVADHRREGFWIVTCIKEDGHITDYDILHTEEIRAVSPSIDLEVQ